MFWRQHRRSKSDPTVRFLCSRKHAGRAYRCCQTLEARWSLAGVRLSPAEKYWLPETLDETLAHLAPSSGEKGGSLRMCHISRSLLYV